MLKKGLKSELQVIRNSSLFIADRYLEFGTITSPIAISLHPTRGLIAVLCIFERVMIYTEEGYFVTKLKLKNHNLWSMSFRYIFAAISFTDSLLILQPNGGTIYHFSDYGKKLYTLPIQFYDCDKDDNVYATCLDSWLLEKHSPCLGYKQYFSGYQCSFGNIIDLRIKGEFIAIECEESFGSEDKLKCNPILLFSLLGEQLIRTLRADDHFIHPPIHFCMNDLANIFIHNSYGNKLVICSLEPNANYIVSENNFFKGQNPFSVSKHTLKGIRINGQNQIIRCFSSGVVRVISFDSLMANQKMDISTGNNLM